MGGEGISRRWKFVFDVVENPETLKTNIMNSVDKYLTNISKTSVNPNSVDYKPPLWQHQNFLGEKWEIQAALRIPTPTQTP